METTFTKSEEIKSTEYLLRENPQRFVVFPVKHNDIWEGFKIIVKPFG